MTITYPLTFPSVTGVMDINWRAVRADVLTQSPTTFVQQVIRHQGQRWEADISLPPMKRASAEEWIGFLLQLDGRNGTFLMTPPEALTPRGSAGGTPVVFGASQTGSTLAIDGGTVSTTGYLKAGDFIQLWTGSATRLHKVVKDADTNASGEVTVDIWPNLRESPADNATVVVTAAKGRFRLDQPIMDWSVNNASIFGITFGIVEAI